MAESAAETNIELGNEPISLAPPLIRTIVIAGACLLTVVAVIRSLDLDRSLGLLLYNEQYLFGMLGVAFFLVFLHLGIDRKPRTGPVPWYDLLLAVLGLVSCGWLAVRYPSLADIVSDEPPEALITGGIIMVLVAEGLRRTAGPILLGVLLFFLAFGVAGQFVPGQLQGRAIAPGQLIAYLTFDTNSLVGAPLKIVTTIVVAFLSVRRAAVPVGRLGLLHGACIGGHGAHARRRREDLDHRIEPVRHDLRQRGIERAVAPASSRSR